MRLRKDKDSTVIVLNLLFQNYENGLIVNFPTVTLMLLSTEVVFGWWV